MATAVNGHSVGRSVGQVLWGVPSEVACRFLRSLPVPFYLLPFTFTFYLYLYQYLYFYLHQYLLPFLPMKMEITFLVLIG